MKGIANNPRIAEEELRAVNDAKDFLKTLGTRWPTLDAAAQVAAIQEAAGALVRLKLADSLEADSWLNQVVQITGINRCELRKTVKERAAGFQGIDGEKKSKRRKRRPEVFDDEPSADGMKCAAPALLVLPSGFVTISETAEELFSRIARTRDLYLRGGVAMRLIKDQQGVLTLEEMRPPAFRSSVERYEHMAWRVGEGNELVLKPVTLPEDMARALLEVKQRRNICRALPA